MHVVLLTDGISPYVMGGMQRHSAMLARHLPAAGCRLTVFHTAFTPDTEKRADLLEGLPDGARKSARFEFVQYPPTGSFLGHYVRERHAFSKRLLERYLKLNLQADFIYAQGLTGTAFVEARQAGIKLPPIGVNLHGYEMFQEPADLRRKIEQFILRPAFRKLAKQADVVFSFSSKIRDIVENTIGVEPDRIAEIPNAVENSWLREPSLEVQNPTRLVFVGRWERRKGIEKLYQVLTRLKDAQYEMHFIGPIPKSQRLILPQTHYHGAIHDETRLISILDQCDALICCSYAEGMPTVILEAMARGLAIVATNVGATEEIVSDANGILIPSLDVDEFEQAMRSLLSWDSNTLLGKKQASRQKVEDYTWTTVSKRTFQAMKDHC